MTLSSAAAIWGMLGVLALMATFMVVERFLFLLEHSEADPVALGNWLSQCKRGTIECSQHQGQELGWLGRCLAEAGNNRLELHRLLTGFRQDTERFGPILAAIPNLAQMTGLLGTATGIGMCKIGDSDPYALMGLAIETTKCGLAIAIPTLFALSLLNKRTRAFYEQVERVLERLDQSGGRAEAETTADVKRNPPRNDDRARQEGNGRMAVNSRPRARDASPPEAVEPRQKRDTVEEATISAAEEEGGNVRPSSYDPVFEEIYFREENGDEAETDEVGASSHKGNGHHAGGESRCTPY